MPKPPKGAPPKIIYHRANSLDACRHALQFKADMIEFDIRKTGDGTLVAFHDPEIDKQPIKDMTYQELREVAAPEGFDVPTLEEIFQLTQGKTKLDIELKEEGYEGEVLDLAFKYFSPEDLIAKSFNHRSVRAMKDHCPELQVGWLLGKSYLVKYSDIFPRKRYEKIGADFIAPNFRLLKLGLLRRFHKRGMPVYLWTVNKTSLLQKYISDHRVHAVITDHLQIALKLRQQIHHRSTTKIYRDQLPGA